MKIFFQQIRVHQWAKNILVFVPFITAHKFLEFSSFLHILLAFLAFNFCASGLYLLNDILDLEADRNHLEKKNRPLASGKFPLWLAISILPFFLLISFGIAWKLPKEFIYFLLTYAGVNSCYSYIFKKIVLLDVITLASLYTLRILAGASAIMVPVSEWLLVFSMFLFLSLALAKRAIELKLLENEPDPKIKGRGYITHDLEYISSMGIASGFISALVLALYVNSPHVRTLYRKPELLWFICPILLYWIGRVWLLTRRGIIHSDPVVSALKDKATYVIGICLSILMYLAI